ncbi:MAG: hypothetical protein PVG98_00385 [Chromatiales bacterium]
MTGISFGEQPRSREDRLWFSLWLSDWSPREVVAVDLEGDSEVVRRAPAFDAVSTGCPMAVSGSSRTGKERVARATGVAAVGVGALLIARAVAGS